MTKLPLTLATLTITALLALGSPALASHGDDGPGDDNGGGGGNDDRVIKTGSCSDGARWKLKVKTDDGGLEVEGEVDSNTSGQRWGWKVKDNGSIAAKGSATTSGASGSFSVERRITDQAGTDTIVFRASHSGEVCSGTIAF
jgi:hypothetical protein